LNPSSARSAREAATEYLEELQRAISTVARAVFFEKPAIPISRRLVTLGREHPIPLRGPHRLALSILLDYEVVNIRGDLESRWNIQVAGYNYALIGSDGGEIVAFHWHPDGRSPVTEPHVHIKGTVAGVDLSKAHIPTGMVGVQSFLRFVIRDFGVEPLRPDWRRILSDLSFTP
jgi:hypothetical protein